MVEAGEKFKGVVATFEFENSAHVLKFIDPAKKNFQVFLPTYFGVLMHNRVFSIDA